MLGKVDSWQFNAFSLHEVSGGRPLSMLSFFLFKRFEVGEGFRVKAGASSVPWTNSTLSFFLFKRFEVGSFMLSHPH